MKPMTRIHAPDSGANPPVKRRYPQGLLSGGVAAQGAAASEAPAPPAQADAAGQSPAGWGNLPATLAGVPQGQLNAAQGVCEASEADMAAAYAVAPQAAEHAGMAAPDTQAVPDTQAAPDTQATPAAAEEPTFADMLMKAVQERTQRAEKSVLRSIAAQSGIAEDALFSILTAARAGSAQPAGAGQPAQAVPEAQAARAAGDALPGQAAQALPVQTQEPAAAMPSEERSAVLGRRLVAAEVRRIGAEMGLVDAEVALALIDPEAMTVNEAGEAEGVTEALNALKAQKSYLFARAGGAWAERLGGGLAPVSGVEEAFYRKNPALRR